MVATPSTAKRTTAKAERTEINRAKQAQQLSSRHKTGLLLRNLVEVAAMRMSTK